MAAAGTIARPDERSPAPAGLHVRGVSKTFVGTKALDAVTAAFPAGAITALLGQNGSGKSTLIKILSGFHDPDPGAAVTVGGEAVPFPIHAHAAHAAGLRFLHQDLGLVEEMTVADNFALAEGFAAAAVGPIRQRAEDRRVAEVLDHFHIAVSPRARVRDLTPTERTMVAIARAFGGADERRLGRTVLILDEPTASLPASEVGTVFAALRRVRDAGGAVVFVSHRIDEVLELADRLVVLRDGRVVAERGIAGLSAQDVVTLIVGRELRQERAVRARSAASELALSGRGLRGRRLRDASFDLRRGEVLGVTGLLGCGRSELLRIAAGVQRPSAGELRLGDGTPAAFRGARDAIAARIAYVPQDRRRHGCIPEMRLRENLTLPSLGAFWRAGWLRRGAELTESMRLIDDFGIRPSEPERVLAKLSGGNQQKAVVAKWVRMAPRVLVLDEPTQGVDIGAKREIAAIARRLADEGVGVLIGSSDFDELVHLCDRVLVLNRGAVVAELEADDISEERLTMLATNAEEAAA